MLTMPDFQRVFFTGGVLQVWTSLPHLIAPVLTQMLPPESVPLSSWPRVFSRPRGCIRTKPIFDRNLVPRVFPGPASDERESPTGETGEWEVNHEKVVNASKWVPAGQRPAARRIYESVPKNADACCMRFS